MAIFRPVFRTGEGLSRCPQLSTFLVQRRPVLFNTCSKKSITLATVAHLKHKAHVSSALPFLEGEAWLSVGTRTEHKQHLNQCRGAMRVSGLDLNVHLSCGVQAKLEGVDASGRAGGRSENVIGWRIADQGHCNCVSWVTDVECVHYTVPKSGVNSILAINQRHTVLCEKKKKPAILRSFNL